MTFADDSDLESITWQPTATVLDSDSKIMTQK